METNQKLTENNIVEQPAIKWLKSRGYSYVHGSKLTPEEGERKSYRHVILKKRFINAIKKINPWLTDDLAEKVYNKISDIDHPDFMIKSKIFYEMLVNGVKIKVKEENIEKTRIVKIIDFENPDQNEFLVSNQFEVEYQYQKGMYRRPDLVIFINGLPLIIGELKGFNSNQTAKDAFYDHKIKMEDIPQLYIYAQILIVSDGLETKYGSISSDWERFFVWEGILSDDDIKIKKIDDEHYTYIYKKTGELMTSLEVLIKGLLRKEHLLEYIKDFIIYDKSGENYIKKIAMYHQFYAVKKAVEKTKKSVLYGKTPEEKRIGIIWHTQGSGKSLTMLFYAKKVLGIRELENPLLLFMTDRRDLDKQLYEEVFSQTALFSIVEHAESIKDLQRLIKTKSGGIVIATIQKFGKKKQEEYPLLTERNNIIVVADEAHRSQYKELAMNLRKALPNASFIGFTATPVELRDRSTTLVFGEYISVYSMDIARRHGVVVPIYYEARLPQLHLTKEFIDEDFEELDENSKSTLFRKLEEIVLTSEDRMEKIAKDIVEHFNKRNQEFKGKAMIVTLSRKAAILLYEKIIKQKNTPSVEVVISGNRSKDPKEFWPYIRNKKQLEELQINFKDFEQDPQMVIVVDMWLTGFDVPCLHTIYFDKPMKNHSLFQAIARVNRVFKDKPGGLIVDYIGISDDLKKSFSLYTRETINDIFIDLKLVIDKLKEKYDIVNSFFHGIDYREYTKLSEEDLSRLTTQAYERVIKDEDTKRRFIKNFVALKRLYTLSSPHPEAYKIKDDIRFFEMIKKMIVKYSSTSKGVTRELEYEINTLISKSISASEPIDVFALMNKEKPEVSIFDEKFLEEFRNIPYKNYAAEVLIKIVSDQIKVKTKINPIRYKSLYEKLKEIIEKHNLKLISTVEIIEELINLAHEIKKQYEEGKKLDLTEEELAFYDLLSSKEKFFDNEEEIKKVAKEIIKELSGYIKIKDWKRKEFLKAKIRNIVKKILMNNVNKKVGYKEIERLSLEVVRHIEDIFNFRSEIVLASTNYNTVVEGL